jgi:outer membrane scaffolding protein for murein synthesis (MipA/OmpV family)
LKIALRLVIAAFALAGAGSVEAADLPSLKAPEPEPTLAPVPAPDGWIVTVSGQVTFGPSYPGAQRYSYYGIPAISLRRIGEAEPFSTPDDGFSFAFYNTSLLRVGSVVRVVGDRSAYHNPALRGLPYEPYSLELGAFAEVTPISWGRLRVELRKAVTGYDGLAGTVGGDVWQSWNRFTLSAGPRLYFGDNKYASTYFSVTPAEAALSQIAGGRLTVYNAVGGLTSAGATAALRYDINDDWRVTGFGNYQRLTGSSANSPLAGPRGDGTRDQWNYGLEVAYRFKVGGQLIPGLF